MSKFTHINGIHFLFNCCLRFIKKYLLVNAGLLAGSHSVST
nr:MAG TPA: hypothetical protein [Caudoviricetes sp.]